LLSAASSTGILFSPFVVDTVITNQENRHHSPNGETLESTTIEAKATVKTNESKPYKFFE
jgi:hypothetical protein